MIKVSDSRFVVFSFIKLIFCIFLVQSLNGCLLPVVCTGAAVTGVAAKDERTVGKLLDDVMVKSRILNRYGKHEQKDDLKDVSVQVSEGRVLLTGLVPDNQAMALAVQIAWDVNGTKEVINEISLGEKKFIRFSKDKAIKSQIKTKYLFRKDLASFNYTVIVDEGDVYLFGLAQNEQERDEAIAIARTVKGVRKVINHVLLKTDDRR